MSSYRQALLYDLSTLVTLLAGETRVHSYDLVPSTCSLCTENIEERAPAGVHDGLSEMVIFHHITDSQVFYHNALIAFGIGLGRLEMVIAPLSIDLEMSLCYVLSSETSSMTAFLAPAQLTLLAPQGTLRGTIIARVLNAMALTIRQERFQPNINADSRMFAQALEMFVLWLRLAEDERVPVPICTQNKMYGLRSPFNGSVQLNLEEVSQFLGDNEMFLLLMQVAVFPVLPELNGMPPVWFLETRESNPRNGVLFGGKEAFERLGETVSKHLDSGGRHMLTPMTFESMFQIILTGERACILILLFDHLEHTIIDLARLSQASHEQTGLILLHVQSVLKCFHVHYHSP